MGTDTKGKQEVEATLLARARVFTDEVAQSVTIGEAQHAIAAGLIREADPDVILDMLYAPLYYRLLVGHQPLTAEFVREHVTLALNGLATGRG